MSSSLRQTITLAVVGMTLVSAPAATAAPRPTPGPSAPVGFDAELQAVQERLEPALVHAINSPGFATAYFEGGSLVIRSTDVTSGAAIVAGLEQADRSLVQVVPATYSRAELEKVQIAVEEALTELVGRGIVVNSVGINDREAMVDVGVSNPTGEMAGVFAKEFGPAVRLKTAHPGSLFACNNRGDCGTMGGLSAKGKFSLICTTGFLARQNVSGSIRMMTAGHCIANTGGVDNNFPWKNLAPLPLVWGENRCVIFGHQAAMDSGCFDIPTLPADRNQYFASGTNDTRDIVASVQEAGQWVGRQICRGGHTSGWDCGNVIERSVSKNVGTTSNPIIIRNLFVLALRSAKGDSGAGMVAFDSDFDTFDAGTLVGGYEYFWEPLETWYSTSADFQSYFAVTVCHNNGCT